MVLAQSLGDADRQAPRDEKGDRGPGTPVGCDQCTAYGLTAPSSAGPENRPQQQHENRAASNPIEGHSSSTGRWNDVPRGTMDEVRSYFRLDLLSHSRQGRPKDCSTSSSNPMMEGPWCRVRREARARERHRTLEWWIA